MEQGVFSILYETQIVAKAGRNRWKRTMEWCVRAHVLLRERNNSSRLKATLGGGRITNICFEARDRRMKMIVCPQFPRKWRRSPS